MKKEAAIEVRGLTKRFGDVLAVDNVSFRVEAGEMFFLLGPSGCGKTTILRILAGLETADSGDLIFTGKDVSGLEPHKRCAPMVFQNYALWPHLNVSENVAFGLVERGIARADRKERVKRSLDMVGLAGYGDRMPGQLSGGQQQRVVLARALVLNPNVILLDEPLSNLDAKLRAEMREEIRMLHYETNITFVYVTHDQIEALTLADRMAVMNEGKLYALGTPDSLYRRPPNRFCAGFLGDANFIDGLFQGTCVHTSLGLWKGEWIEASAPVNGTSVTLLVRPESIRPFDGGTSDMVNSFDAKVISVQSHGATRQVTLKAGEKELRAMLLSESGFSVTKGQTAKWYVDPANTVILGDNR